MSNKQTKLNYFKEVDKKIKMIPITFDVEFKSIFERNLDLLKRFLISTLNLDLDINTTTITISNNELIKENNKEYQKRVDILAVLNDNIYVDVEVNRSLFEKVKKRNSLYSDKIYSMLLEKGNNISKLNDIYFYQLNLNVVEKSIAIGEDVIVACSLVTKEIFLENKVTFLKNLEFYRHKYYTNIRNLNNLSEEEIWLAALTASTFTELNEMLSHILNKSDRERLVKEAIRMSKLEFNISEWEAEKINELVKAEAKRIDREEGYNDGIEKGIEKGIEQNKVDVIKAMLSNNLDLEIISNVTGKTILEIEKIKKELNIK